MKQIENNYVERMNIGTHYTYNQSVLKRAEMDPVISSKTQLVSLLTRYRAAFLVEEEKFKLSQKSEFTDTLNTLDENRDNAYRGFKQIVNGYAKVPDAEIQTAAKATGQLITDYRINVDVQRDQESGLLSNFIADLEGKCAAHVQTLHLEEVVQVMKAANEEYIAIRESRTEERMLKEKKALETARAATDAAYRSFIAMVNALAMVEGDADYANFITYMNTLIEEYKTEALNQKPSATTPETEGDTTTDTPTEPETPDTGGDENGGTEGGDNTDDGTTTDPDNGGGYDEEDEGLAG